MANTQEQLKQAFEMIQREQIDEAVGILRPITEAEPENADAWWLLANASSEPRDARRALVNALKINPAYPKARALLDQLNELYPPRDDELMLMLEIEDAQPGAPSAGEASMSFSSDDSFDDGEAYPEVDALFSDDPFADEDDPFSDAGDKKASQPAPAPKSDIDSLLDDVEDDGIDMSADDPFADMLDADDPLEQADEDEPKSGLRRRILLVGLVAVVGILLCIVGALVFLGGGDDAPAEADATQASPPDANTPQTAANNTDSDSDTDTPETQSASGLDITPPESVNADGAANLESVRQTLASQAQAIWNDQEATAFFTPVADGHALVIQTCTDPLPTIHGRIREGMDLVARQSQTLVNDASVTQVGLVVLDCSNPSDTLYQALSPMSAASTYSNSTEADALPAYQAAWDIKS